MAEVDIDAELAKRKKAKDERMQATRDAMRTPMVNVTPAKEEYRKYLKHPGTGVGFDDSGTAAWPHDQFTKRRVRDGSVTIEEQQNGQPKEESSLRRERPARQPPSPQHTGQS